MASSMTLPMPSRSGPDSSPLQFSHIFEDICSKSLVILCQKNDWPWVSHSSLSEKFRFFVDTCFFLVADGSKLLPSKSIPTSIRSSLFNLSCIGSLLSISRIFFAFSSWLIWCLNCESYSPSNIFLCLFVNSKHSSRTSHLLALMSNSRKKIENVI